MRSIFTWLLSKQNKPRRETRLSRSAARRRLLMESLEDRRLLATDGPFVWVNRDAPVIAFVEENGQRPLVENTFSPAETAVVDAALQAWNDRLVDVHNGQNRIEVTITKKDISEYGAYGRTLITPGTPGQPVYADLQFDDDALSLGWFVDVTPTMNDEFPVEVTPNYVTGNTAPGIDLLSVVSHELAHAGGYSVFYETFFAHVSYNDDPTETANCSGPTPGGLRSVTKDGQTLAIMAACPSTHFDVTAHPHDLLNEQVANLAVGDRSLISYRDLQILAQTFDYDVVDPRLENIESQIADRLVQRRDAATPEERARLTKQIRELRKRAREIRGMDEPIIGPTPVIPIGPEITNSPPIITLASVPTDVYARELVSFAQYVLDVSDPNGNDTIESIKVRTSGRSSESGYLLLDDRRLPGGVWYSLPVDPTNPNACFDGLQYVGAVDARPGQVEISVSDGESETRALLSLPTVGDSSITDDVLASARDIGTVGTAWIYFRDDVGGVDYDSTSDPADYYRFTMGGGTVFEAKLTPTIPGVELQFQLLAADGSWLTDPNEEDGLRRDANGRIASQPRTATSRDPVELPPVALDTGQNYLVRVSSTARSTYLLDMVDADTEQWNDKDLQAKFDAMTEEMKTIIRELAEDSPKSCEDGDPETACATRYTVEQLTAIAVGAANPTTTFEYVAPWFGTNYGTWKPLEDEVFARRYEAGFGVPKEVILGVVDAEVARYDWRDWRTHDKAGIKDGSGYSLGIGQVAPGTAAGLHGVEWSKLKESESEHAKEEERMLLVRLLQDDQVNMYYVARYLQTRAEILGKWYVFGDEQDELSLPDRWAYAIAYYQGNKTEFYVLQASRQIHDGATPSEVVFVNTDGRFVGEERTLEQWYNAGLLDDDYQSRIYEFNTLGIETNAVNTNDGRKLLQIPNEQVWAIASQPKINDAANHFLETMDYRQWNDIKGFLKDFGDAFFDISDAWDKARDQLKEYPGYVNDALVRVRKGQLVYGDLMGRSAQVTDAVGNDRLAVRAGPGRDFPEVGTGLSQGEVVDVVYGPVVRDQHVWWEHDGGGWSAGKNLFDGVEYLVEGVMAGASTQIIYPVNGSDWYPEPGSTLHTENNGIGQADDRNAMDLNRPNDLDYREPVYAIADGFVERNKSGWGGPTYGQLLLKHFNPDGSVYYSGYLHMENITSLKSTQGAYVAAGTQIGTVSNVSETPGLANHLHFAVYEWDGTKLRSQPTTLVPAQARPSVATVGEIMLNGNRVNQSPVPVDRSSPFLLTATVENTGSTTVHGNFYLLLTRDANGSQFVGKVDELDACSQLLPSERSTLQFEKPSFVSPPGDYYLQIYFDDCSTGNVALKRVTGTNPISIYLKAVSAPAHYDVNSELNGYVPVSAAQLDAALLAIRPDNNGLAQLGQVIVDVAQEHDINPYYIAAHAAWETGWGTSPIFRDKNNPFGYGAFDRCPYECAVSYATLADGFDKAMAKIKEDYLTVGGRYYNGSTLAGMHVYYATDENWADGISQIMNSLQQN